MSTTAETSLDQIDVSDPDLFVGGAPYDLFKRLRHEDPVHWNPRGAVAAEDATGTDHDGFWSVTRFEDLVKVKKDSETFSSARRSFTIRDGASMSREFEKAMFLGMDPPEHTKHRMIVQRVFTPRAISTREDDIRAIVCELLDGVAEQGECDLVDVVKDLPTTVTAEMLGVPLSDREKLLEWTNQFVAADDEQIRKDPEGAMKTLGEMAQYLVALVQDRRETPRDDLLSKLVQAEWEGHRLTDQELVADFVLIMGGGVETTRNSAAAGVLLFDENPDERRKLLEDPSLLDGAVEEILRYHAPFMNMCRTATRDTEIAGVPIKEGHKVALWYLSANRDEAANPDPDRFDISRPDRQHVAFGGGGRHHCLGAQLARLELKIFFEELFKRIPDMAVSGPVMRLRSNFIQGFLTMPVTFTPTAKVQR